ncbi:unnamed protein product [Linum trigynum]|uniref:Transposase-associated domain-containing protein n=1 Tax=Linum trigynum TaxID=586398 RepID=A0AAV2FXY8_9ROSI
MSREWIMLKDHWCADYELGVNEFMEVASKHVDAIGRVRCPCKNCNNLYFKTLVQVRGDIFNHGMVETYKMWVHHGESYGVSSNGENPPTESDDVHNEESGLQTDMSEMLGDFGRANECLTTAEPSHGPNNNGALARLLKDANCPLYPDCKKISKLSYVMKMMNIKIQTNSSDKAFNQYLELIKEGLPNGETLPTSFYEVKKYMRDLGFGYTIIDACPNNCVLYRGQLEAARECPKCKEPRFKSGK